MAVQALCTPVRQKHRNGSMHPTHIYYYTYLTDNFSQVARKMCLMGFFQVGRAKASLASGKVQGEGEQGEGKPRPYM